MESASVRVKDRDGRDAFLDTPCVLRLHGPRLTAQYACGARWLLSTRARAVRVARPGDRLGASFGPHVLLIGHSALYGSTTPSRCAIRRSCYTRAPTACAQIRLAPPLQHARGDRGSRTSSAWSSQAWRTCTCWRGRGIINGAGIWRTRRMRSIGRRCGSGAGHAGSAHG